MRAVVLGLAQDGGHPQAGCVAHCCAAAWQGPGHRVASLGLRHRDDAWLIDATPDIARQLHLLGGTLRGIFLTHAHVGHYTGLMHLGREAMNTRGLPVYVMPRMRQFLCDNAPWEALVRGGNIRLVDLHEGQPVSLDATDVRAFTVPHRDEYSETVGFEVSGPEGRIVWIPDVDDWKRLALGPILERVDTAYLDGTFHGADELAGRDPSEVPHPLMSETLAAAPAALRERIRFIHLNHSNPTLFEGPQRAAIRRTGADIAQEGETVVLQRE